MVEMNGGSPRSVPNPFLSLRAELSEVAKNSRLWLKESKALDSQVTSPKNAPSSPIAQTRLRSMDIEQQAETLKMEQQVVSARMSESAMAEKLVILEGKLRENNAMMKASGQSKDDEIARLNASLLKCEKDAIKARTSEAEMSLKLSQAEFASKATQDDVTRKLLLENKKLVTQSKSLQDENEKLKLESRRALVNAVHEVVTPEKFPNPVVKGAKDSTFHHDDIEKLRTHFRQKEQESQQTDKARCDEIKKLKQAQLEQNEVIKKLKAEVQEAQQKDKASRSELEKLQADIVKNDLQATQKDKTRRDEIATLQTEIQKKDQEVQKARRTEQGLTEKLQSARGDVRDMQKLRSDNQMLQSQVDALKARCQTMSVHNAKSPSAPVENHSPDAQLAASVVGRLRKEILLLQNELDAERAKPRSRHCVGDLNNYHAVPLGRKAGCLIENMCFGENGFRLCLYDHKELQLEKVIKHTETVAEMTERVDENLARIELDTEEALLEKDKHHRKHHHHSGDHSPEGTDCLFKRFWGSGQKSFCIKMYGTKRTE